MNNKKALQFILISVCIFALLALTGCGQKKVGNTIPEPEITTDYLTDEYSRQLITDGAETIQGSVSIQKADDSYTVHISEMEVVPSDNSDDGYYLADTNVVKDVSLGFDARIVCMEDDEPVLSDAESFIENHPDGSDELYTVYLMGDSAELIMAVEPETLIEESE